MFHTCILNDAFFVLDSLSLAGVARVLGATLRVQCTGQGSATELSQKPTIALDRSYSTRKTTNKTSDGSKSLAAVVTVAVASVLPCLVFDIQRVAL